MRLRQPRSVSKLFMHGWTAAATSLRRSYPRRCCAGRTCTRTGALSYQLDTNIRRDCCIMTTPDQKAEILIQALPYIREFAGATLVVKYGGNAMIDEALKRAVMTDIVLMRYVGINPILVHGGGPEVSEAMRRMGQGAGVRGRPARHRRRDDGDRRDGARRQDQQEHRRAPERRGRAGRRPVRQGRKPAGRREGDPPRRHRLRGPHHLRQPGHHPHADARGVYPRDLVGRHRRGRRGVQRQRRHGGGRARGRPGRHQAHPHDRRRGLYRDFADKARLSPR